MMDDSSDVFDWEEQEPLFSSKEQSIKSHNILKFCFLIKNICK